jgi:sugar O-acyltransferase (sialic acid O-acetyltransferase NeuD family)
MKPLFILGAGGQAREVADIGAALDYRPVFVTRGQDEIGAWDSTDEIVREEDALRHSNEAFAIGIGDNRARSRIAADLAHRLHFPNLIHPEASFGRGQRLRIEAKQGVVVFAGVRFTNNISVGNFCNFNLSATISHDCEIGDFVSVSPGASIAGNVRIGTGAWIGLGARVNQGTADNKLMIGEWTIIGSGTVVTRDCMPDSVYVGVPARKIR